MQLVVQSSPVLHLIVVKKGPYWGLFLCLLLFGGTLFCCGVSNVGAAPALASGGEFLTSTACDITFDPASAVAAPSGFERVAVVQVFDGDTVLLKDGRKIRIVGVNTPELGHHNRPVEPLAQQAKQRLVQILSNNKAAASLKGKGTSAYLKTGGDLKDHYGRTLGHLFSAQGVNVSQRLLEDGLGFHVSIPPNLWAADCYYSAQQVAMAGGKGVWNNAYFDANSASQRDLLGGYQRLQGKIEKLFISQKTIWIDLQGQVTLKLGRSDSDYHQGAVLKRILDAHEKKKLVMLPTIEVQGWLMDRKRWGAKMMGKIKRGERNRWQLNVRHHYQWRFLLPIK